MSTCLRNIKKITQNRLNWLIAFYKLAKRNGYSIEQSKRLAVYSVNRMAQESRWVSYAQVLRIEKRLLYKGKETVKAYDRLVAGREATEEINLWYIDGVQVDEQIVMHPETQTIEQIEGEENSEVKRVRIERFGWSKYLSEIRARVLDVRDNDIDATKESLMELRDKTRVIVCACPSTARVYVMRVPREIVTCEMAQNWLHGNRSVRVIGAS